MASPSRTEIETQWQNAVKVIEDTRADLDADLVSNIDSLEQDLEGDYTPRGLVNWAAQMRSGASALVDGFASRIMLEPLIYEYGKLINSDARAVAGIMPDIYRYMHDNSLTVNSRDITYATPSYSGTGNGSLRRLTVDENAYDLENCHVELKTARCMQDQLTGADKHAERFDLFGINAPKDGLDRTNHGSGRRLQGMEAKHAGGGAGGSRLLNSSFTVYNASGTVTTMYRGWTLSTTTSIGEDTSNTYRGHPGDGDVQRAIQIGGAVTLTQTLRSIGVRVNPNLPYFGRVMYNRQVGSGAGTLTIRMGAQSNSVVLSAQTGWNELAIAVDENLWPINWYEDDADFQLEWTHTSGTVLLDDVWFGPWDFFDGTYWLLMGGSTPFKLDGEFTMTDTGGAPATAKIQYYNWLAGVGYMPSATGGAETWADPS